MGKFIMKGREYYIVGFAFGAAFGAALGAVRCLVVPRRQPSSDRDHDHDHRKDKNVIEDSSIASQQHTKSSAPSPATDSNKQASESDKLVPCSALAKYCTTANKNGDTNNHDTIDDNIVGKSDYKKRSIDSDTTSNTTNSKGNNKCFIVTKFCNHINSTWSDEFKCPQLRELFCKLNQETDHVVEKKAHDLPNLVPCDQLPFFLSECRQNFNCRHTYNGLIWNCVEQRRSKLICGDTREPSVQIPELDMLLIPFRECMSSARHESELEDCWENYGRYLKTFRDKV